MITCYFGLPGCGKSSMLAKIAVKELRRIKKGKSIYDRVLSNYYIEGCQSFDFIDIGKVDMSNSLILIDEISLDADNRDFKSFNHDLKQFFILHRHYHIDIVYATQQYDGVDRKIRELTANLYYIKKLGRLSVATAIYRQITINDSQEITVGYKFPRFIQFLTDARNNIKVCFRPIYYKYFDSFDAPKLPRKRFKYYG